MRLHCIREHKFFKGICPCIRADIPYPVCHYSGFILAHSAVISNALAVYICQGNRIAVYKDQMPIPDRARASMA